MKHIVLTYEDERFQKLKDRKVKLEEDSEERISWENFVYKVVCGK